MNRWYLIIIMALLAAGCVRQVQQPVPPQPVPSAPLNQNVSPARAGGEAIDTNDYLDQALEELDSVETGR